MSLLAEDETAYRKMGWGLARAGYERLIGYQVRCLS
jgi:hypothetical protein